MGWLTRGYGATARVLDPDHLGPDWNGWPLRELHDAWQRATPQEQAEFLADVRPH
jgi:hypothetical protein